MSLWQSTRLLGAHRVKYAIFADAALENDDEEASIGVVLAKVVDQVVVEKFFFSERVPREILKLLQVRTPKVVAGLELMAATLAVRCFRERFKGHRVFFFVENKAARASMIAMKSSVLEHVEMLKLLSDDCRAFSLFMWTRRQSTKAGTYSVRAGWICSRPSRAVRSEGSSHCKCLSEMREEVGQAIMGREVISLCQMDVLDVRHPFMPMAK